LVIIGLTVKGDGVGPGISDGEKVIVGEREGAAEIGEADVGVDEGLLVCVGDLVIVLSVGELEPNPAHIQS